MLVLRDPEIALAGVEVPGGPLSHVLAEHIRDLVGAGRRLVLRMLELLLAREAGRDLGRLREFARAARLQMVLARSLRLTAHSRVTPRAIGRFDRWHALKSAPEEPRVRPHNFRLYAVVLFAAAAAEDPTVTHHVGHGASKYSGSLRLHRG